LRNALAAEARELAVLEVSDDSSPEEEPEEILDEAVASARLGWESFGLSFVLGGDPNERVVELFGEEDLSLFDLDAVRRAVDFLEAIEAGTLQATWNPERMRQLAIYPESAWTDEGGIEHVLRAFETVRGFYRKAVQNGWCAVVDGRC
jgi:hypothetical protein